MPRRGRSAVGGVVYHVLNRANGPFALFEDAGDYEAFERLLVEGQRRVSIPILAYCLMPTHWHLVLWPRANGDLSNSMRWVTLTHARRWHAHRHTSGSGHVYQGRFKSFPVQSDNHFLTVCRYVERNPVRAGLVGRAQDWRWSSLGRLGRGDPENLIASWPVPRPPDWSELLSQPVSLQDLNAARVSVTRGRPFGSEAWCRRIARRMGLEPSLRPRGRPPRAKR